VMRQVSFGKKSLTRDPLATNYTNIITFNITTMELFYTTAGQMSNHWYFEPIKGSQLLNVIFK